MNNASASNVDVAMPAGRPAALQPLRRQKLELPPFSSWLLLLAVTAKPLADAFYEEAAVKYGYMLVLAFAALFAKCGHVYQGLTPDSRNRNLLSFVWLVTVYFFVLFGSTVAYGGSLSEIFKIVSPFVFFILVAYAADRWLSYALLIGAVLTILINAALLPFDYGWVNWGSVHTFKGYYFFKTDLAYALTFAVLTCAFYARNSITPTLALLTLVAAAQVVLANSRLNYVSFVCVMIFIGVKEGLSLRALVRYGVLFGILALLVVFLYDPTALLGFDISNEEAFTQGRSVTWSNLVQSQLNSSPLQWAFGRGPFADLLLSAEMAGSGDMAHNAHNEVLHLLFTQGIVGSAFYAALWFKLVRMSRSSGMPAWARGTGAMALLLFTLQGITTVVSSFATKTWPLVMVFLALRGLQYGVVRPTPVEASSCKSE